MASLREPDLEEVVRAGTAELFRRLGAAVATEEEWASQLRAVAYALRDFLREDEPRARAMMLEAPHGSAETREIRQRGIEGLVALIDQGRQELEDPEAIPRSAAEIAAGAIYNRIHIGVEAGPSSLDDEMVRELMYTAVMPYLGIEAALAELEAREPGSA